MADQSTQPTWDAVVLAGQLHTIAKQSQSLMRRFAASQADATKMGMGDTSTLGFDFVDLMTKMMSDPTQSRTLRSTSSTTALPFGRRPRSVCG